MATRLKMASYNLREGGIDNGNEDRWREQMNLLRSLDLGVIFLQELHGWEDDGAERFYRAETILGRRGLFAPAPMVECHLAIFINQQLAYPLRWDLRYTRLAWHAFAQATLHLVGLAEPLTAVSVHLSPWSPEERLSETALIAQNVGKARWGIAAGDYNSVPPGDQEPPWGQLPRYKQAQAVPDGASVKADRRVGERLERAGLVDAARELAGRNGNADLAPTGDVYRCDQLWVTRELADRLNDIKTVDTGLSDHRLILAEFDIG